MYQTCRFGIPHIPQRTLASLRYLFCWPNSGFSGLIMDVSNWYQQGFALAAQAVEADNAKEYKKAFDLYSRSLDHIIAGLKCAFAFYEVFQSC